VVRREDPARGRGQVAADQVVEHAVRNADHPTDRAFVDVEDIDEDALPAQQSGQGHDERGDLEPGDERALERADDPASGHAHDEAGPPGPVGRRPDQGQRDGRAHGADKAHGEVDLAEDEGVQLGQAQQDDEGRLDEQVDDVGRREERARLHLEENADDDEADDDGDRAALTPADPQPPGA
jgi:hypothetical protein